tara:strand:- start:191 stop:397 length:207 start_codon:yes stop_codon:yes gene_type:complete
MNNLKESGLESRFNAYKKSLDAHKAWVDYADSRTAAEKAVDDAAEAVINTITPICDDPVIVVRSNLTR